MSRKLDAAIALMRYVVKDRTFYGIDLTGHSIRVFNALADRKDENLSIVAALHHLDHHRVEHSDIDQRFGERATTALLRLSARELAQRAYWHTLGQTDDNLARIVAGACLADLCGVHDIDDTPTELAKAHEMRSIYAAAVQGRAA